MSKKQTKPYDQMTTAELREATREFDQSGVMARARPLSAKDRELHRRAKKMGRPVKGAGATVVGVSIEKGLLKQADALAKRRKVGRSQLFAAAIQAELARAKAG
jgi:ribosomal protein S8